MNSNYSMDDRKSYISIVRGVLYLHRTIYLSPIRTKLSGATYLPETTSAFLKAGYSPDLTCKIILFLLSLLLLYPYDETLIHISL